MRWMVLLLGMFSLLFCYACAQTSNSSLSASTLSSEADFEPVTVLAAVAASSHGHSTTPPAASGNKAAAEKPKGGSTSHTSTHRPRSSSSAHSSHHIPRPSSLPSPETPPHMPIAPPHPDAPVSTPKHHSTEQKYSPVAIVFETLGGIVAVFLLFTLGRCFWSWRRMPERNRIETVLNRHYIQREMEERRREDMQRRLAALRTSSGTPVRPPPPPYQPAPSYEDVSASEEHV